MTVIVLKKIFVCLLNEVFFFFSLFKDSCFFMCLHHNFRDPFLGGNFCFLENYVAYT